MCVRCSRRAPDGSVVVSTVCNSVRAQCLHITIKYVFRFVRDEKSSGKLTLHALSQIRFHSSQHKMWDVEMQNATVWLDRGWGDA